MSAGLTVVVLYVTLLKEMPVGELVGASVGFSVKVTRGLVVVVVVDDMGAYMEPGVVVVVVISTPVDGLNCRPEAK